MLSCVHVPTELVAQLTETVDVWPSYSVGRRQLLALPVIGVFVNLIKGLELVLSDLHLVLNLDVAFATHETRVDIVQTDHLLLLTRRTDGPDSLQFLCLTRLSGVP